MTSKLTVCMDLEVYRDYFLAGFLNVDTGNVRQFEMWPDGEGDETRGFEAGHKLDLPTIRKILSTYRVVTFNGNHYDMVIMGAALRGASCRKLKDISDQIIQHDKQPWQIGIEPPKCDHIDVFEVAPGVASLKVYGGRLHTKKMQELPIHEASSISPEQRSILRAYNSNDLSITAALYAHLKPELDLREEMSKTYGIDVRSKSDAQIAEAVIVKEVEKALGRQIKRPEIPTGTRFRYTPPAFIEFATVQIIETLDLIRRQEFVVTDRHTIQMPDELKKAVITIRGMRYKIGIGGLHSQEKTVTYYADEDHVVVDKDVRGYYPAIIVNNSISPPSMGSAFMRIFKSMRDTRDAAKKAGDKVTANTLKITTNGGGGKLNQKWSKLYYPQGFIQMTLTGQLAILMLIEKLEVAGIRVVSANTDGIAIHCRRNLVPTMDGIVADWERNTGFEIETTEYQSLHKHSVNSYIGLKTDGKFTLKGEYVHEGLCPSKDRGIATNPSNQICVEAVTAFLRDGVPIAQTVAGSTDLRKFITIRRVEGGAKDQAGDPLGKIVRWYYATSVDGPLRYAVNGHTVPRSEGARACMELPEMFPDDVDVARYVRECEAILTAIGVDSGAHVTRGLL